MAYTLLDVVNTTLRRARLIDSQNEVLASLVVDTLQLEIDSAVDAINDTLRELYDLCDMLPWESNAGTLTLVTATREYALPTGCLVIESERFVDQTNGAVLTPYPGGYYGMFSGQSTPGNYTGQPHHWVINPINDKIRLDTEPTAAENGDAYEFIYSKDIRKTTAAETFSFVDAVIDSLMPAIVETYKRDTSPDGVHDPIKRAIAIGHAVTALTHQKKARRY